jgi:dual specificity tyrosine-phosphorylation-regulated kinase 2/3/4
MILTELLKDTLLDAYTMKREMFANLRTIQIFARQILIALQKLHQLHIAHTDLKPENILIKSYTNRTLKVIDVGSSVFFHD